MSYLPVAVLDVNSLGFQHHIRVTGMTGGSTVWGQMATGGRHKPFAEMMAVLGVPAMPEIHL